MDDQKSAHMISGINQLFSCLGDDHEQNINRIIAHTCKILKSTCSLYNRINADKDSLVTRSGYHLPSGFQRIVPLEGSICFEKTVRNIANPTIIEDLSLTSFSVSDINASNLDFNAYMGFPVMLNDPDGLTTVDPNCPVVSMMLDEPR